jgi:gliding motility-associated-like protein
VKPSNAHGLKSENANYFKLILHESDFFLTCCRFNLQTQTTTMLKLFKLSRLSFVTILVSAHAHTQIVTSNNSVIHINSGALVYCNGGIELNGTTQLTNNGTLYTTKNSTLPLSGNFIMNINSSSAGNGDYFIEQDWKNNAIFNGDASTVHLYGNTEQFISSDNFTETIFNNLILTGSGVGAEKRKTLQNTNASCGATGFLTINNRELATEGYTFGVLNPTPSAISYDNTFLAEGFVSSILSGSLVRATNSTQPYIFPVGSSIGTERFRSVKIAPESTADQSYSVRFNNYSADLDSYFLSQHETLIDNLNSLYYHSIEQKSGNSNCEISVEYLPTADGDWKGLSHWYLANQQWNSLGDLPQIINGNYTEISRSGWNFPDASNAYVLINPSNIIIIPTAFTPDGDGVNEEWVIPNLDKQYPKNSVRIYNRWGSLLFEHDSSTDGAYATKPWDGTFKGDAMPVGSYYYIIDFNTIDNKSEKGIVTIVNK